ncbi:MAG: hypothetical protein QOE59_4047, partial [Actinomycetota bacterium]|nr:hypothetical protein [Actinomycetota bacterium]
MLDSGLRFAFAFLPAGVAIVVGLVLAVQRRRVQPAVALPAIAGLALQLVAALLSASTVVVLPALLRGGSSTDTVLTASSLIGVLTALITVLGWVLLLIALFRRLPASAPAAAAPPRLALPPSSGNSWQPGPARGMAGQPPADDAPTGRHALLDEHGQQVVAQPGVRLSPRTAALTGGAAALGVAAGAATAGDDELLDADDDAMTAGREEDLPTEAVPIVGHRTPGAETADPSDGVTPSGTEAPDAGPGGVDEAAVGGMPTEATAGTEAAPDPSEQGSRPTPAASPGALPRPWPGVAGGAGLAGAGVGAAGVAAAAHTTSSTGAEEREHAATPDETPAAPASSGSSRGDAATETIHAHTPAGATAPEPAVETADVDEAAVGGPPTVAEDPPADPGAVSVDEGAVGGVPASAHRDHDAEEAHPLAEAGHDEAGHDEAGHDEAGHDETGHDETDDAADHPS